MDECDAKAVGSVAVGIAGCGQSLPSHQGRLASKECLIVRLTAPYPNLSSVRRSAVSRTTGL
jgi:hypothetical protein